MNFFGHTKHNVHVNVPHGSGHALCLLLVAIWLIWTPASSAWAAPAPGAEPAGTVQTHASWSVEHVDMANLGQYSSIALDSAGWPHISYYDFDHGDLKYAYKNASGWHIETVDAAGNVGGYTSLALDALDQPNISYCLLRADSLTECDDLKFAIKLGGIWYTQTVDSAGYVGGYTSLAVEGGPRIEEMSQHISYYDHSNSALKYCFGTGAMWTCETVDDSGDVGKFTSLAVAFSHPHVSYMHTIDATHGELKYAHNDGSQWTIETVDGPGYNTGAFSSLEICTSYNLETPRIAYYADGKLGYAHHWVFGDPGPHWSLSTVDSRPPAGVSFEIDELCQAYFSYYELYNGDLRYYYPTIQGAVMETVDNDNDVWPFYWSSLALDSTKGPHISFYDDSYGGLSYAHIVSGPAPPAATITSTPVTAGVVGQLYGYDVEATGNPTPTFSLIAAPTGMVIDAVTGLITWTPAAEGSFEVIVQASNGVQPDAQQTFTIVVEKQMPAVGTLAGISTRGIVGTDANVLIGGFIVSGAPVTVVVTAKGPSMAFANPPVPGTLQDPVLQPVTPAGTKENNDWLGAGGNCLTDAQPYRQPTDTREACIAVRLDPGAYTAIVSGANKSTGVGLVEVYYGGGDGELAGISTRGSVGTDANVLIGGFIVSGAPMTVVVTAKGPSMAFANPPVPGTLQDPVLQPVTPAGTKENNDWLGAGGNCLTDAEPCRQPIDTRESCIAVMLDPGAYTGIVSGANKSTGVGLVEVYSAK